MEKTKTVDASEITAKLSYTAPELTELGEVAAVTCGAIATNPDTDGFSL